MKYILRSFLLAVGMISLSALALYFPVMYVIHFSEFENPIQVVATEALVIGLAGFLLWVVGQAWNEFIRLRKLQSEQKLRQVFYDQIPSWGAPPRLPNSSAPVQNPPKN